MPDIASIAFQVFFVKLLVKDHLVLLIIDINDIMNTECIIRASRSSHHVLLELVFIYSLWPAVIFISLWSASPLEKAPFLT